VDIGDSGGTVDCRTMGAFRRPARARLDWASNGQLSICASHTDCALGGLAILQARLESIVNRSPNMWTLVSLGVAAAYLYSIFATFLPGYSRNNTDGSRRRHLF
jgi:Cu+-exporting ATPase